MIRTRTPIIFLVFISFLTIGCREDERIIQDTDLTDFIEGSYSGVYTLNYENDPSQNFTGQFIILVEKVDNTHVRIDAQGGDTFECELSGNSRSSLTLLNMANTTGVYTAGETLEGNFTQFQNGSKQLEYTINGTFNGGTFAASFATLL
ncbi:MAG TPA: hypothetical protein DDX92_07310 [Flavobacteriales bacterium]|jgi:hypothetical protein|nr:hypothetical protein [Flavobacteriales bacterium]